MRRHCKYKCRRYGELVALYQDGPMTPTGMISWRCPECGLYDLEFISDNKTEAIEADSQLLVRTIAIM